MIENLHFTPENATCIKHPIHHIKSIATIPQPAMENTAIRLKGGERVWNCVEFVICGAVAQHRVGKLEIMEIKQRKWFRICEQYQCWKYNS